MIAPSELVCGAGRVRVDVRQDEPILVMVSGDAGDTPLQFLAEAVLDQPDLEPDRPDAPASEEGSDDEDDDEDEDAGDPPIAAAAIAFANPVAVECALAIPLGLNEPFVGADSRAGSPDRTTPTLACTADGGPGTRATWFRFSPTRDGPVSVNITNNTYNTAVAVFPATECPPTQPPQACGFRNICVEATIGEDLLVLVVDRLGGDGGVFDIRMIPRSRPANDQCASATEIPGDTTDHFEVVHTRCGTTGPEDEPFPCLGGSRGSRSVWWRYTPVGDKDVSIVTSDHETAIAVHTTTTGACDGLSPWLCDATGAIEFFAADGVTYLLEVVDRSQRRKGGSLRFRFVAADAGAAAPRPEHDACTGALPVDSSALPAPVHAPPADTFRATADPTDPRPSCAWAGAQGLSIWYVLTPPISGVLTLDTEETDFATSLTVFTGVCGDLTEVACNTRFVTNKARVCFWADAGVAYSVMLGSRTAGIGAARLSITSGGPVNDDQDFALPIRLDDGRFLSEPLDTRCASADPFDPVPSCLAGAPATNTVWFWYEPPSDHTLDLQADGFMITVLPAP